MAIDLDVSFGIDNSFESLPYRELIIEKRMRECAKKELGQSEKAYWLKQIALFNEVVSLFRQQNLVMGHMMEGFGR